MDDDFPMTTRLERAFVARTDEPDSAARAVLDVAALDDGDNLGEVLAAARIAHGAPIGLADVEPAQARLLLRVTGDTYEIPQPLIGSALRAAMSRSTREQIHRRGPVDVPQSGRRTNAHRSARTCRK
jgi:hypothetical protein